LSRILYSHDLFFDCTPIWFDWVSRFFSCTHSHRNTISDCHKNSQLAPLLNLLDQSISNRKALDTMKEWHFSMGLNSTKYWLNALLCKSMSDASWLNNNSNNRKVTGITIMDIWSGEKGVLILPWSVKLLWQKNRSWSRRNIMVVQR